MTRLFRWANQRINLLVVALFWGALTASVHADDPVIKTVGKFGFDAIIGGEGEKTLIRYGNWYGPGWWGGSELDQRDGILAPIDSLDEVAQKHDFGYLIAEKLGKGRPDIEALYKAKADIIAAREAMALNDDPAKWPKPAPDPKRAKPYLERIKWGFPNLQQRLNEFKSRIPHRADITDPDVLNQMLDGYPDDRQFETMMNDEVQKWKQKYQQVQAKKPTAKQKKNETARQTTAVLTGAADEGELIKRVQGLNHAKMQAVFNRLGVHPTLNFYHCLCKAAGYGSSGTSQLYHPDTIGKYDPRYSCNHPGEPCVVAGYGCTRHPLPSEPDIWEGCMERHRLNMTTDANGREIPGSGQRLDQAMTERLQARSPRR